MTETPKLSRRSFLQSFAVTPIAGPAIAAEATKGIDLVVTLKGLAPVASASITEMPVFVGGLAEAAGLSPPLSMYQLGQAYAPAAALASGDASALNCAAFRRRTPLDSGDAPMTTTWPPMRPMHEFTGNGPALVLIKGCFVVASRDDDGIWRVLDSDGEPAWQVSRGDRFAADAAAGWWELPGRPYAAPARRSAAVDGLAALEGYGAAPPPSDPSAAAPAHPMDAVAAAWAPEHLRAADPAAWQMVAVGPAAADRALLVFGQAPAPVIEAGLPAGRDTDQGQTANEAPTQTGPECGPAENGGGEKAS